MKWKELEFKEFVTLQRGFDLPQALMQEGEVPVLGSSCIIGYHNQAKVQPPGVVTGRSGTLGVVQYIDVPFWPHNTALWVRDFKQNDPRFVYYKLWTLNLDGFSSGASVPTLNRNNLDNLKVTIPSVDLQCRLASVLSAYDDLIENNLRRIKLLEESARLLYKEWFVRLRFPGHEHTRIINGVPEGWEKKILSDIASVVMGQSPKSQHYNDVGEGLPFHQGVSDFGERFISHSIYCSVTNRIAEPGDILCSVRAPVGRLNITIDKIIIGRGLAAMRSKLGTHSFLYYQLRNHFFKEDMIGGGAIFASVTRDHLGSQKLLNPPAAIVKQFEEFSRPIDREIQYLFLQNQKAKQARDILLPKLMSGEMKV